jgi:nitrite reductase (NO-forming)
MFMYIIFEIIAAVVGIAALVVIVVHVVKKPALFAVVKKKGVYIPAGLLLVALVAGLVANRTYPPNFAMPAFMHSHAPGGVPASIPFRGIVEFFAFNKRFDRVQNIGANPASVPAEPLAPDADGIVRISLRAQEVIGEIAPGISFNYWTYDKQVPGPMLRIRQGDTVELTLTNDPSSLHDHSIDLHAVTGPGGGAGLSHVAPGETKVFQWKALNPGLYIYHCAMPNVSTHNSHGQYGLILVEPREGLSKVDKEFYIVQGELYTIGDVGKRGLVPFDSKSLIDGNPNYVVFNGQVENTPRLHANVGDRVRIYIGNGGVNLISSFHVIGEIFDTVYPEGAMGTGSSLFKNVQTTAVLPGGSSIVEFTVDTPGDFLLVDHALARMNKGAWAVLQVAGDPQPDIIKSVETGGGDGHSHAH